MQTHSNPMQYAQTVAGPMRAKNTTTSNDKWHDETKHGTRRCTIKLPKLKDDDYSYKSTMKNGKKHKHNYSRINIVLTWLWSPLAKLFSNEYSKVLFVFFKT